MNGEAVSEASSEWGGRIESCQSRAVNTVNEHVWLRFRLRPDPSLVSHYDQRSEERKSRRRRKALEANLPQYALIDGGVPVDEDRRS